MLILKRQILTHVEYNFYEQQGFAVALYEMLKLLTLQTRTRRRSHVAGNNRGASARAGGAGAERA